jgi:hypothetical protein
MTVYVDDVRKVVSAIVATPLGVFSTDAMPDGQSLRGVIRFTPAMEKQARDDAKAANAKQPVTAADIRTLFAGVAHAFVQDPQAFVSASAQVRFNKALEARRSRGVRAVKVPGFEPVGLAARQRAIGDALLSRIEESFGQHRV